MCVYGERVLSLSGATCPVMVFKSQYVWRTSSERGLTSGYDREELLFRYASRRVGLHSGSYVVGSSVLRDKNQIAKPGFMENIGRKNVQTR